MPKTPVYALRLPAETQEALATFAKLCGYRAGRTFAAHVLRAATSGDLADLERLRDEIAKPVGVQTTLQFSEPRKRPTRAAHRATKKSNGRRRITRK